MEIHDSAPSYGKVKNLNLTVLRLTVILSPVTNLTQLRYLKTSMRRMERRKKNEKI